jgi:hypothetical protein
VWKHCRAASRRCSQPLHGVASSRLARGAFIVFLALPCGVPRAALGARSVAALGAALFFFGSPLWGASSRLRAFSLAALRAASSRVTACSLAALKAASSRLTACYAFFSAKSGTSRMGCPLGLPPAALRRALRFLHLKGEIIAKKKKVVRVGHHQPFVNASNP